MTKAISKTEKNRPAKRPKTGGRQKGVSNKLTADARESVQAFLDKNWPQVQTTFDRLGPAQKLYFFEKMLGYTLPKPQQIGVNTSLENLSDSQIEILFAKIVKQ